MTAPVFGDFLAAAREHIDAAASVQDQLSDNIQIGVIRRLERLVTMLARYAGDLTLPDEFDPTESSPDGHERAAADARQALQFAADSASLAVRAAQDARASASHAAIGHLAAAADHLAAGRDLLQTHFATDLAGVRAPASDWASVLASPPVTIALLAELADCALRLAPLASRLPLAGSADSGVPVPVSQALRACGQWLWISGSTMAASLQQDPPSPDSRALLGAVPANFAPPRHLPAGGETVTELCAGAISTSEWVRRAAEITARQVRWPLAAAWRRDALAAAILGHCSQSLLHSLASRAGHLGADPAVAAGLGCAADASGHAWAAWRAVAHAWDTMTTGHSSTTTPAAAQIADLTLWIGRLAHDNLQWTPARSHAGSTRDPANLAPAPADLATALAAIQHAAGTLTQIAEHDRHAVRQAAADQRLYIPTRLLPEAYDIPRPYASALQTHIDDLLTLYDTAAEATSHCAAAMDAVASTLHVPASMLINGRVSQRASKHQAHAGSVVHEPTATTAPSASRLQYGPTEQTLHELQISDPGMLVRARNIDRAAHHLIEQATAKARRFSSLRAPQNESQQQPPIWAARVARKDLPCPPGQDYPVSNDDAWATTVPISRTASRLPVRPAKPGPPR